MYESVRKPVHRQDVLAGIPDPTVRNEPARPPLAPLRIGKLTARAPRPPRAVGCQTRAVGSRSTPGSGGLDHAVEETSLAEARRQLETNPFGGLYDSPTKCCRVGEI